MIRRAIDVGLAALLSLALTALVTWPQARDLGGSLFPHHDTYFSIWRLGWIAHALSTSPRHLFDANVFSPASGTLTYSDATLLQGLIAAPMLWAGVKPTLVYNLLLAVGYAGSGLAMFVLARYLTGRVGPALIATAAFTLAPYRTEHVMHLELQWAMWVPLTVWAVLRTIETTSWRWGATAGCFFFLQVISCVYYGVFLAMVLCALVPLLLVTSGVRAVRAIPALAVAGVTALVLVAPYAWPYMQTSLELGARDVREVAKYSARPVNYLASSSFNRLWGWTADRWGGSETRLFPGAVVVVLALASVLSRSRRWVCVFAVGAGLAVLLSFGINSAPYRWMYDHSTLLRGLRVSARLGIIVSALLSVLAALGAQALSERTRWKRALVPALLVLMTFEGLNRPLALASDSLTAAAPVYRVIRSAGEGVVLELPIPRLDALPGWDAYYSLWSMQHWYPLINGYSGYYPQDYVETMARLTRFPDDVSTAQLRSHRVRYIVIHRAFYEPERYAELMLNIGKRAEFVPWGAYGDAVGAADVFELRP